MQHEPCIYIFVHYYSMTQSANLLLPADVFIIEEKHKIILACWI